MANSVHILGMKDSGIAAAKLMLNKGWDVIISESSKSREMRGAQKELQQLGATTFIGGHDEALKLKFDLVVVSPGIPPHADVIQKCNKLSVPIIGELELGYRYCMGRLAAISGSNGKSTTTALLGNIFKKTGALSFTCGNIGRPLTSVADLTTPESLLAVEVSSYQLATIDRFRPEIALLLNITPDHLAWHQGFENYKQAKARLWLNFDEGDPVVYFADDEDVVSLIEKANVLELLFSISRKLPQGAFLEDDEMVFRLPQADEVRFDRGLLKLPGRHNSANALAAITAALYMGIDRDAIEQGLSDFNGLPHRLEFVRERNGVTWINDSKCTNVDSGKWALEAVGNSIVMIAGGESKGGGFCDVKAEVAGSVKMLILIGEAANEIEQDLGDVTEVHHASDLTDAVQMAYQLASSGDKVLLAPLCASFDMFRNFEQRGDMFREAVLAL